MERKSLGEIMAMSKVARYGYLYGMGANTLEVVLKNREALEGEQVVVDYVFDFQEKPNAVQLWLKS